MNVLHNFYKKNPKRMIGMLLSRLFPSVGRHHFTWITPEEIHRTLLQIIRWVDLVDDEQKQFHAILSRHLMTQMRLAFGFQLIQQIFVGSRKQSGSHCFHRCWSQATGVNETEKLVKYSRLNVFNHNLIRYIIGLLELGLKYFAAGWQNTFVSLKLAPMDAQNNVA